MTAGLSITTSLFRASRFVMSQFMMSQLMMRWTSRLMLGGLAATALLIAPGCGPIRLVATTNIPPPLIVKIPVTVALYIPKEFSTFVHNEERSSTDWSVDLGKAQSEGLTRLLTAMFERVVMVDSINAGSQPGSDVRAILEPSIEEYAFVTPRDAGSPFFAVSIKYRVNVYTPEGRLADSWGFTGYGTAPSKGMSSNAPLTQATALALRDAGAKLAVEFREQAIVRGLLPESVSPDLPTLPVPTKENPPAENPPAGNLPAENLPAANPPASSSPPETAPPPAPETSAPETAAPETVSPPSEQTPSEQAPPPAESDESAPTQNATEIPPAGEQPEPKPEPKPEEEVPGEQPESLA